MTSLREKGRRQLAEAHDAYKASSHPAASGIILHRKGQMVIDGKFKWIPCVWSFRDNALVLTPCAKEKVPGKNDTPKEETFEISEHNEYMKPKRKHYPIQFGRDDVHTTILLQKVVYAPTGYAPSALDPMHRPLSEDMKTVCKLGALDLGDLEKILTCIQALVEGKPADAYL
mmetsp:Transcript_15649/g.45142  ORF Transcript_15649/g.45142 Transcript_15649/m.45142 type:complete len:172 (-) Transcript_15649:111-626(-)